jgi:hypothetical protein
MRDDDSKIADAELIMNFLAGDGTPNYRFPKRNSPEELKARRAIARVIRDYVPGFSGELLALAFDPGTKPRLLEMRPTRKIQFEQRGMPSSWRRERLTIDFIKKELKKVDAQGKRKPLKAVIVDTCAKFGIKCSTAHAVWKNTKTRGHCGIQQIGGNSRT